LTVEDVACVANNIDVLPSDIAELLITCATEHVATKATQELLVSPFIHIPDRYKPAFIHGTARRYLGKQHAQKFSSEHANALTPKVFQIILSLPIQKQEGKVDWEQIFVGLLQTILPKMRRLSELKRSVVWDDDVSVVSGL
jgi:hypothetical protein